MIRYPQWSGTASGRLESDELELQILASSAVVPADGPISASRARRLLAAAGAAAVLTGCFLGYRASAMCPPNGPEMELVQPSPDFDVVYASQSGQEQQPPPASRIVDQPLNASRQPGWNSAHGSGHQVEAEADTETYIQVSEGRRVELRISDGTVESVKVDGQEVPTSRVASKDGAWVVTDADGKELSRFERAQKPGIPGAHAWHSLPGGSARTFTVRPGQNIATVQRARPPVMLGITMSEGSDEEPGIEVLTVREGLPANKAGVEEGDRIISIDGGAVKTSSDLREVLSRKKAGDVLKLQIERDGEKKDLEIKLEAYDAKKLGSESAMAAVEDQNPFMAAGHDDEWYENAIDSIARAMEQIKSSDALNSDKFRAQAMAALEGSKAALESARAALAESRGQLQNQMDRLMADPNMLFLRGTGRRPQSLRIPSPPPAPAAPGVPDALGMGTSADEMIAARLERLTGTMEKLDRRLEKMERRLEETEKKNKGGN